MTDAPLPLPATVSTAVSGLTQRRREFGLVLLAGLLCGALATVLPALGADASAAAVAGITLPLLLRLGVGLWPGAWFAAFALAMLGGRSFVAALLLASAAAGVALLGAVVLRHLRMDGAFARKYDVGAYLAVATAGALLASLATLAVSLVDAGTDARAAVPLRALGAALVATLALGPAVLSARQTAWPPAGRNHRIALPLAVAALAMAAAGPFLPAGATHLVAWGACALLCGVAWRAGALPAALATAAAIALRLAAEPFAQPVPAGDALGFAALDLLATAALWGSVPLFVAAWRTEATAREHRWSRTLEAAQVAAVSLDLRRQRVTLSARWQDVLGLPSLPRALDAWWAMVHPDDLPALRAVLVPSQRPTRPAVPVVARLRSGALDWRRLRIVCLDVQFDEHGRAVASQAVAQDVTDADAASDQARVAARIYDQLGEGLLITDPQGRVVRANTRYTEITGERPESLVGTVPRLLRSALTSEGAGESESQMRRLGTWQGEVVDRRRNGELCTLSLTVTQVRDEAGAVTHHTVLVTDLTQAREHREQLERKALTDELTQLPNRLRLVQLLETAMRDCDRHGGLLTICSIDLDHFKAVNDRLGPDASDGLLVALASRLREALREVGDEVLARVGGDEFVLLMRAVDVDASRQAVQRVLDTIAQPIALGNGVAPLVLSSSIGATVYPKDRADAETLLRHAGHALWGVKQAGRNGFQFFDAERHRQAEARFSALGRVQEAFDADEFCLHFQPKVDMRRGKVLGAEALLRWTHPEQGIVPPGQFLPLIENTPLAVDIGTWVLRKGVEQLAQWHRMGLDMSLSVNVSARLLQEPMFGKYVAGLLQRHRVPLGRKLILEVLETAALKDLERTRRLMDECRELGVRFALDDFGTGFSNLNYLRQLPVDMLKIDRSFVSNMLTDKEDLAIVEGVLALARTFGCAVVAEGVETAEQARRLIRMGCDIGQGNGIAAAMPLEHMLAWSDGFKGIEGVAERPAAVA